MIRIWLSSFLFLINLLYASPYSFVFVHLGPTMVPYLSTAVDQVHLFNPKAKIYVLGNKTALEELNKEGVEAIAVESLQMSESHRKFHAETPQSGFWKVTIERFLYLDDFIQQRELSHIFHLENDVMLYRDLSEIFPIFLEKYQGKIGAVFDTDTRCIPGFIYISSPTAMRALARFIGENAHKGGTDMDLLSQFKDADETGQPLPIVLPTYCNRYPLQNQRGELARNTEFFLRNFDTFSSIFDAACIGQYWGGIDPIHRNARPGFINETAFFNPSYLKLEWEKDEKGRFVPWMSGGGARCQINNLHIHCKNLKIFYSGNEIMPPPPFSVRRF